VSSDPDLIEMARKQLRAVLASGSPAAFLGWWTAWRQQDDVDRDDLIDLVKSLTGGSA
jgi:hypothetical protein